MIELNLLPDIKLDYIKTQRTRRLVFSIAALVTLASIVLLILLLSVDGLQKKHLNDLNRDITSESNQLQHKPNINEILTVQNQLGSLTNLHAGKPAVTRLFDYLNTVTPATVSISDCSIDFTQYSVILTGTADTLTSINQYIDTLKHATYSVAGTPGSKPAFSNVVLGSFALTTDPQDPSQAASYTINLSYDKTIFDITQSVTLTIPSLVTTRSGLPQPSDLFTAAPSSGSTSSGGSH